MFVLQGACTVLVVIACVWFVCGFAGLLDKKDGYSAFQTVSCFKVELLVALETLCRLCYVSGGTNCSDSIVFRSDHG